MSLPTTYTEKEIRDEVRQYGWRWLWLENSRGEKIITQNPGQTSAEDQLNKIFRALNSKAVADGLYYIMVKQAPSSKTTPVGFAFMKGNVSLEERGAPLREHHAPPHYTSDSNLSMKEMLEMITENASLKTENNYLTRENDQLRAKLEAREEMIESLREANSNLSESEMEARLGAKSEIEEMTPIMMLMMDKMGGSNGKQNEEIVQIVKKQQEQIEAIRKGLEYLAKTMDERDGLEEEEEEEEDDGQPGYMDEEEMLARLHPRAREEYLAAKAASELQEDQ